MSNIIYHYTYIIINTTNQMKYIGVRSCNCLPENDSDYMGSSKILNEAMKVEPEDFTKTIIDTFPTREMANADEQRLHKHYDVARNPEFYNQMNAPLGFCTTGKSLSEDHKKKIGISTSGEKNPFYGKTHTDETKKKLSKSQSGEKNHFYGKHLSPEHKKKISENHVGMKGTNHSETAKKKIGEAHKGKPLSEEHKRKISESKSGEKNHWYGKKFSAETRAKMSKSQMGKKFSSETRKKLSLAAMGKKHSIESRKKMSVAKMGKSPSEETRKKISETLKDKSKKESKIMKWIKKK